MAMTAVGAPPLGEDQPATTSLLILFGSETGNAEELARAAASRAGALDVAARVADMADIEPADLGALEDLLVIASTYNDGDPPERAEEFFAALMADDAPRLDRLRFAVLALGDRSYEHFCGFGHLMDERLAALGGTRVRPITECDFDYVETAERWIEEELATRAPASGTSAASIGEREPALESIGRRHHEVPVRDRLELHGPGSASRTARLTVALTGTGIEYEPGDVLEVLPRNDPRNVEALVAALGCDLDDAAADRLIHERDITTVTVPLVVGYAAATGHSGLERIVADPAEAARFAAARQVLDLVEAYPGRLHAEQLLGLLRPLPPRSYSIASSRTVVGDAADLVVGAVRWRVESSRLPERMGVASGDLLDRRRVGDLLTVAHKPNPHFRLPADPDRPIVMIGPGTGIAPFRGFLQERETTGARGRNWLVFGHRNAACDALFGEELAAWQRSGLLTRFDTAYSRDQSDRVYVQHRLWEARRTLRDWLADGAALYVCGSVAMGADVEVVLERILVEDPQGGTLGALKHSGRYLRDVY